MASHLDNQAIQQYLNLLDAQRENTFAELEGIPPERVWQRPEPSEWCIGEILNHNVLLFRSMFPLVNLSWRAFRWLGKLLKSRPYRTTIEDPYSKSSFPHWTGFLWTPRYSLGNPVPLDMLIAETRQVHRETREFYENKEEAVLGHVYLFDPLFGFINLVVTLRIGIHHDQHHYRDILKLAESLKKQ